MEFGASRRRQLVGQEPLDVAMRVGARGGDHARERVDRRAQHAAGTQVLAGQRHQRGRRVVLDRPLAQPAPQRLPVGLSRAAPTEVREHRVEVVAARLRASAVGEELVLGRVDLPGDEPQGLVRR